MILEERQLWLTEGQAAGMVHTQANSKVSRKQVHTATLPCIKGLATGGLILISPQRNLPYRSGTYSNLKPSCLLQCCKIYKRITSLNRLALQTQMQTSHNTEGAGQEEEKYSQRVVSSHIQMKSAFGRFSSWWRGLTCNFPSPRASALLSWGLLLLAVCLITLKIIQRGPASHITCRNTSGSTEVNTIQCSFPGLQREDWFWTHTITVSIYRGIDFRLF